MLRIEVDLFEKELYWLLETAGRVTELLRAGLEGWMLSDSETESLEALVVETDLVLFLGANAAG